MISTWKKYKWVKDKFSISELKISSIKLLLFTLNWEWFKYGIIICLIWFNLWFEPLLINSECNSRYDIWLYFRLENVALHCLRSVWYSLLIWTFFLFSGSFKNSIKIAAFLPYENSLPHRIYGISINLDKKNNSWLAKKLLLIIYSSFSSSSLCSIL